MLIDNFIFIARNYKSKYSNIFNIDHENKTVASNCGGLFKYLLNKDGITLPERACEIYDFFKQSQHLKILDIRKVQRGDIILWKKKVIPLSGDSGHLSIIDDVIQIKTESALVRVYDSVKNIHQNDSRENSGLGHGEIELLLNGVVPCGFRWLGDNKKTKFTDILIVRI